MKKNYIAPSMKVRAIETEAMMAASDGQGFAKRGNVYIQDFSNVEKADGSAALSNYNVWSVDEDDSEE